MPNEQYPTGAIDSPHDQRRLVHENLAMTGEPLPRIVSHRSQQSKVFTQWLGSCVGAGSKSVKEAEEKRESGTALDFSYKALYAMCKANDGIPNEQGTYPIVAMQILAGQGIPLAADWANTTGDTHEEFIQLPPQEIIDKGYKFRIDGFVQVTTIEGLKDAINKYGECGVSFSVFDTFDNPKNGHIKPHTAAGYRGSHWVVAVGYNDDTREIEFKNSWGKGWGDDGYGYLSYDYNGVGTLPFNEALAAVDYVAASQVTTGAPVDLAYPTDYRVVTQHFGENPQYYSQFGLPGHNGVDIRAPLKTNIYAVDAGKVIWAATNTGYGRCIKIQHAWGISLYAHLDSYNVTLGQQVTKKQKIGFADHTGNVIAGADHLHLGGKINGVSNPAYGDWVSLEPYIRDIQMTKYFRITQDNGNGTKKSGVMIVEGFSGTVLFENEYSDYLKLLQITNNMATAPQVTVPAGRFFRLADGNKLGILVLDGFAGTVLFENDYTEYQTLLAISGLNNQTPQISLPQ